MNGLNYYEGFNWDGYAMGKEFMTIGVSELQDFETKKHLGTKVECLITEDKTPYPVKNGKQITNRYEKIVFKVMKDVDVPIESRVIPKNVVAKVYSLKGSNFRNQLSVTCDDIEVIAVKGK